MWIKNAIFNIFGRIIKKERENKKKSENQKFWPPNFLTP